MTDREHHYFFELLTEEIPAWMLPPLSLVKELSSLYENEFGISDAVEKGHLTVGATTRRIYFRFDGLPVRQIDHEEEVKGPPRKIAFNEDGSPTPALLGFLKKNASTLENIVSEGDYVRLRRVVKGQETADILSRRVPEIVKGLRWAKMMRWGSGEHSYIRPVHSLVSVLDGTVVPLKIFDITADHHTVGHRLLAPERLSISSYTDYVEKLGAAHVVVEAEVRERMMKQKCNGLAEQVGGEPLEDVTIWRQWRYLTEFPGIVRAEFDAQYLELPEEVLTTVMRVHQKQLPISVAGRLSHYFLAVMDQVEDRDGNVASGNSFVTNARFADARFFYQTDRKRLLQDRVEDLAHLQFQEKLGNYLEKTRRIVLIAEKIRVTSKSVIESDSLAMAARLSKADLMTEMVKEFTELQGRIGGIYAREEGLRDEIWTAIYDHYKPVTVEDALPRNALGALVGISDRIDTLAGFFLIGLKPTGSKDPFALRRAAQGVVQMLLNEKDWKVGLGIEALIDIGLGVHASDGIAAGTARQELLDFFGERTRAILEASPYNLAYDELAAAMAAGWTDSLIDVRDRAVAVQEIRSQSDFLSVLDSAKRIANITQQATNSEVDGSLIQEAGERRLWELSQLVDEQIRELSEQKKYRMALQSFAGLAAELESFFTNVLVNVEDPRLRANRMALLRKVGGSVGRIADVTQVVIDRGDYAKTK